MKLLRLIPGVKLIESKGTATGNISSTREIWGKWYKIIETIEGKLLLRANSLEKNNEKMDIINYQLKVKGENQRESVAADKNL